MLVGLEGEKEGSGEQITIDRAKADEEGRQEKR